MSGQRQLRLGAETWKLSQEYYIQCLANLKALYGGESQLDPYKKVHEAILIHIEVQHVRSLAESDFPCSIPADQPIANPHLLQYKNEMAKLAVEAEFIMAAIGYVECDVIGDGAFLAWFLLYSALTIRSFANRTFLPFWSWVHPNVGLTTKSVFNNLHHCAWYPIVAISEPRGSEVANAIPKFKFPGKPELISSKLLLESPANNQVLRLLKPMVFRALELRNALGGYHHPTEFTCRCGARSHGTPSRRADIQPPLSDLGVDVGVRLEGEVKACYVEESDPDAPGDSKPPIRAQFSGGLARCHGVYYSVEIPKVEILRSISRLQTLTFLRLSGSRHVSFADSDPSVGGIVNSLNWVFNNLISLQNFHWAELSPCHDYEFVRIFGSVFRDIFKPSRWCVEIVIWNLKHTRKSRARHIREVQPITKIFVTDSGSW
ncbi:hypothetical protein TWF481_002581 [Arthrobotrys musiformis]|uniref:Uncharacterized protein n=1 Tax=Arthrobotrys musiformis TaxID=47236 RepID=A0AAV9VTJ3_9PEZI